MDAARQLIEDIGDHVQMCLSYRYRVERIAAALDIVGMERLADELATMMESINESAKKVQGTHSQSLSQEVRRADENSRLIVEAVIAGATIQRGKVA